MSLNQKKYNTRSFQINSVRTGDAQLGISIQSTTDANRESCYNNCIKTCSTSSYINECNECYQNCYIPGYD